MSLFHIHRATPLEAHLPECFEGFDLPEQATPGLRNCFALRYAIRETKEPWLTSKELAEKKHFKELRRQNRLLPFPWISAKMVSGAVLEAQNKRVTFHQTR